MEGVGEGRGRQLSVIYLCPFCHWTPSLYISVYF